MVISVDDGSFQKEVLDHAGLALVDVSATWCGPCKMLAPIIHELAESMKETVKIVEADLDQSQTVAATYGIQGVPTLLLFKNGELIDQRAGYMNKSKLVEWIESRR